MLGGKKALGSKSIPHSTFKQDVTEGERNNRCTVWLISTPLWLMSLLWAEQDSGTGCGQPDRSKCRVSGPVSAGVSLVLPSCMDSVVLICDEAVGREALEEGGSGGRGGGIDGAV